MARFSNPLDQNRFEKKIASVPIEPTENDGTNLVLAAVAGKILFVFGLYLSKLSSNTVFFTDGLSGPTIGPTAYSITDINLPPQNFGPIMQTTAGNGLYLDASSSRDLSILISYIEL